MGFWDRPRGRIQVYRRFDKHCSCYIHGECNWELQGRCFIALVLNGVCGVTAKLEECAGYHLIGSRGTALPTKYEIFLVVMRKLLKAMTVQFAEKSVNIGLSDPIPKANSTHYILKYLK